MAPHAGEAQPSATTIPRGTMGSTAASSDDFAWTGAIIDGKYRVDRVVGEGGFGIVYAAWHLTFNEPIAVKCLKMTALPEGKRPLFLERFLDEGRIMFRLSGASTSIVRAIDLGAATSPVGIWTPYLVMEWVEGMTLHEDLDRRRRASRPARSPAEAIALLQPVAAAMQLAHEQGVAHRDLKPANIMLTEVAGRPSAKVLDFGVAKVIEDLKAGPSGAKTGSGMRTYTIAYAAPEQLAPQLGATGTWTDVFALAVVLTDVMTGRSRSGEQPDEIVARTLDAANRPTPRAFGVACPDPVDRVLTRALAVDPRNRHKTAGELWGALMAALASSEPPRSPSAPRVSAPRGSKPTVAAPHAAPPPPARATSTKAPRPVRLSVLWIIPAGLVALAALLIICALVVLHPWEDGTVASAAIEGGTLVAEPTNRSTPPAENDGRDATRPILPSSDEGFVDRRGGWGWGDKCWLNIKAGKWGWAKAECDEGMKLNPASPNPRASLLYNEGLIAKSTGDTETARSYFTESLRIRPHPEVRAALDSLPAPTSAAPP